MSTIEAPNMPQEQDIIDAHKSRQRKKRMSIAIGIFLLIGLLWALYWFFIARYHEETENAYVAGSMVVVNAQTAGTVEAILAEENQVVKAGDVLVKLSPTDAQVALAQASAQLANATRQIQNVFNTVSVTRAQMVQANSAVKTAQDAVNRRAALVKTGAVSREEYDQAVNALNQALAAQKTTMEQNKSAGAQVAGTTTQNHPAIEAAKAAFRSAYINNKRLAVLAPTDGVIAKRNVQVGQQISQGVPLMSIVAANQLWVEANFKETQLANLRVGQTVELTSDVFGSGVKFKGTVQGIGIGTGSAFSVLPAQNATGNWIKIVQRIPVRIQLDAEELKAHPLRVGMSMIANVNTHQRDGAVLGTVAGSDGLSNLTTNVYAQDEEEANREADKIINANLH
jgi:membrane fusion protein (multidrug efflux system)